jgi:hypothetical protein
MSGLMINWTNLGAHVAHRPSLRASITFGINHFQAPPLGFLPAATWASSGIHQILQAPDPVPPVAVNQSTCPRLRMTRCGMGGLAEPKLASL